MPQPSRRREGVVEGRGVGSAVTCRNAMARVSTSLSPALEPARQRADGGHFRNSFTDAFPLVALLDAEIEDVRVRVESQDRVGFAGPNAADTHVAGSEAVDVNVL
ncbi:MAG: hypothetical protein R3282_00140 [Rhodothermales bacterium]|nr:hypothetical protein [Rhodothermales bacterium]